MAPSINYYCPCELSATAPPPPPHLASSSSSFHPLHTLFFCEECDAVRCNRCVAVEVSGYYCPNCLFEVPSASVRAEKNRCARNCFLCPHCLNTLSVVPSDPPDDGRMGSSTSQLGTLGEPPFLLFCNNCRWDSQEVGITFEKPTGLAQQLQKSEDSAPESLEFERLKEHFDPFLRASAASMSQAPSTSSHHAHHAHHINPITAAASSALARDIPGVGKYHPQPRSRSSRKNANKDEMPTYKSRVEVGSMSGLGSRGDLAVEKMKRLENPAEVATLEQIWTNSWAVSPLVRELKPLRIPLHSRLTKRCQVCRHILIKPEQKAQSVRFKIKLVAANYLPAMTVQLPLPQSATKRASMAKAPGDEDGNVGLLAGRTYPFQIALTNPLYDPIQVRLAVQRHLPSLQEASEDLQAEAKARRPPFAVSLPSSAFSIAAFAEAWEYEDDDEMFDALEEDDRFSRSPTKDRKSKTKTVGVLERKANLTIVGGEVIVSKEARGNVKFNMLVSYTYRSDEPIISEDEKLDTKSRTTPNAKAAPEMKTFSFYTVVDLGPVVPRDEPRVDTDL